MRGVNPFPEIEPILAEYGYTLRGNEIICPKGWPTGAMVEKGKRQRGRCVVYTTFPTRFWSGSPKTIGDCLESFWRAKKCASDALKPADDGDGA